MGPMMDPVMCDDGRDPVMCDDGTLMGLFGQAFHYFRCILKLRLRFMEDVVWFAIRGWVKNRIGLGSGLGFNWHNKKQNAVREDIGLCTRVRVRVRCAYTSHMAKRPG